MGNTPFVIFSGLFVILNIGPVYWQILQGNSGPISMGIWVIVLNLKDFINAAIWSNDVLDRAPVWCDISNKIRIAGEVGRLGSVMCIARFLAAVVSPKATAITRQDRRSRALFDYFVCFGAPILVGACEILYQPVRYAIVRSLGCEAVHSNTWLTLVLWLIWPPILAVIGVFYSMYTVFRLIKHRRDFGRVVSGAHSALTTSRFVRLAALSFSYLLIGLPLCIYTTLSNIASSQAYFDYSWDYLHSVWDLHPVLYYPDASIQNQVGLSVWSNVIVAFIFFSAFGFGAEAMATYSKVATKFGIRRRSQSTAVITSRPEMKSQPRESMTNVEQTAYSGPFHVAYTDTNSEQNSGVKVSVDRAEDIV